MDNNLKQCLTEIALEKEAGLARGLIEGSKTFARKAADRVLKSAAPTKGFQGIEQVGVKKFRSPVTNQIYTSASKARRAGRAANKAKAKPPVAVAPTSNQNFAVGTGVLGGAAVGAGAMYAGTRERKKVASFDGYVNKYAAHSPRLTKKESAAVRKAQGIGGLAGAGLGAAVGARGGGLKGAALIGVAGGIAGLVGGSLASLTAIDTPHKIRGGAGNYPKG